MKVITHLPCILCGGDPHMSGLMGYKACPRCDGFGFLALWENGLISRFQTNLPEIRDAGTEIPDMKRYRLVCTYATKIYNSVAVDFDSVSTVEHIGNIEKMLSAMFKDYFS